MELTRVDKKNLRKLDASKAEGVPLQGAWRDRGMLRLQSLELARLVKTKGAFLLTTKGRSALKGL